MIVVISQVNVHMNALFCQGLLGVLAQALDLFAPMLLSTPPSVLYVNYMRALLVTIVCLSKLYLGMQLYFVISKWMFSVQSYLAKTSSIISCCLLFVQPHVIRCLLYTSDAA